MTLPDKVSHHMTRVLRMQPGDEVTLFNGEGGEYLCAISSISRNETRIRVYQFHEADRSSSLNIHLGLCILKKDAMDRVLQYAVELGVTSITPLVSDHCTVAKRVIRSRQDHWRQVALSACEQSGLNSPPSVADFMDLQDWLPLATGLRLICVPGESSLVKGDDDPESLSILTGPEGGLTHAEVNLACQAGFREVTFGQRVLRAETAPLVALSVAHRAWGDY
jgi:16S rRNA (uracil1498-N3)-methyltransferase